MTDYNAENDTQFSLAECEEVVGKVAELHLTGTIVEAREGDAGPFVVFEPDERWGVQVKLGFDLDAFVNVRKP